MRVERRKNRENRDSMQFLLSDRYVLLCVLIFFLKLPAESSAQQRRHGGGGGGGSDMPDTGGWSDWSAWSDCSRSCGGGVAYQTRECIGHRSQPRRLYVNEDRSPQKCIGVAKRYRSCNQELCKGTTQLGEEQCAVFNRRTFRGKHYTWLAHRKVDNWCALGCKAKYHRFYAVLSDKVEDGTPCGHDDNNVCVGGKCTEVGCDDIIGSGMRYDYCGVCGGFNTTCQIISGIYTQRNLPVGYNNIAAIPKGACNISIQEMYPSDNYLAIKTLAGKLITHGNGIIGMSGDYRAAGTVFRHRMLPSAAGKPESITAAGPLTEAITLGLIYQTTNLGIKYEYSIPIDKTPASLRHTPAKNPAAPSPLGAPPSSLVHAQQPVYIPPQSDKYPTVQSHTIEAGKPTAPQQQQQQSSAKLYVDSPDQYARDNVKPAYQNSPAAAGRPSPQQQQQQRYAGRGRLASVYSSDASVLAGGQSRPPVYGPWYEPTPAPPPPPPPRGRYRPPPNPRPLPPTVNQSVAITAPHRGAPGTHVNADDVPRRHRPRPQVLSQFQNEGQVVNPPPHYVTPGNSAISNNEVTSHLGKENFSWRVSGLTACSATCGGGEQRAIVVCTRRGSLNDIVPEAHCASERKQSTSPIRCATNPCPPQWEPSEWGPCSATCGEGIQTRVARCRERISATLTLTLPSSRCFSLPQPEIVRKCISRSCSLWKEGEWGRCSTDCGKGERRRSVQCVSDGGLILRWKECDVTSKPTTSEVCDMGSCVKTWFFSEWTEKCSAECVKGVRSRKIHCLTDTPELGCEGAGKPDTEQACDGGQHCNPHWFTGSWGECTATCGDGVQERDVICLQRRGSSNNFKSLKSKHCRGERRPHARQSCMLQPCVHPEWYTSVWSECSETCGWGVRTREGTCLDSNQTVSTECEASNRPRLRESCSDADCTTGPVTHREKVESCQDTYDNCDLVVQARLCRYSYYSAACCKTCSEHDHH